MLVDRRNKRFAKFILLTKCTLIVSFCTLRCHFLKSANCGPQLNFTVQEPQFKKHCSRREFLLTLQKLSCNCFPVSPVLPRGESLLRIEKTFGTGKLHPPRTSVPPSTKWGSNAYLKGWVDNNVPIPRISTITEQLLCARQCAKGFAHIFPHLILIPFL